MPFRLVSSGGNVVEPTIVDVYASGTIHPGEAVEWLITAGKVVGPAGVNTTRTALFGVAASYAEGASDTLIRVIPFTKDQLWEVDCANAASTAQIGIRQYLSANRGYIHNQGTDTSGVNRVFLPVAMVGSTSGSGKLLGIFLTELGN
uniref:Uncharacterized protein n=1 Tax=candidate division CPR3 bacterium TaxID=2268181 RepID=A0A7V3JAF8_UNCC3